MGECLKVAFGGINNGPRYCCFCSLGFILRRHSISLYSSTAFDTSRRCLQGVLAVRWTLASAEDVLCKASQSRHLHALFEYLSCCSFAIADALVPRWAGGGCALFSSGHSRNSQSQACLCTRLRHWCPVEDRLLLE